MIDTKEDVKERTALTGRFALITLYPLLFALEASRS